MSERRASAPKVASGNMQLPDSSAVLHANAMSGGNVKLGVRLRGEKHTHLGYCWPSTPEPCTPRWSGAGCGGARSPPSATPAPRCTLRPGTVTLGRHLLPSSDHKYSQNDQFRWRHLKVGCGSEGSWVLLVTSESQFLRSFSPEAAQLSNTHRQDWKLHPGQGRSVKWRIQSLTVLSWTALRPSKKKPRRENNYCQITMRFNGSADLLWKLT